MKKTKLLTLCGVLAIGASLLDQPKCTLTKMAKMILMLLLTR